MSVNKVNTDGTLSPVAGGTLYADSPIASILPYGGTSAPIGWLICDGSAVSRLQYAELFAVIGTSFGTGDGSTTFNIPDLRGEFIRGAGTNSHNAQGSGGSIGEHQDATKIPNVYIAGSNMLYTGKNAEYGNLDYASASESGYRSFTGETHTTSTSRNYYTTRPTNTSVNFIIKAQTIALPTDFAKTVNDTIKDNIVDSITDGELKAVTSNAVYDALATKSKLLRTYEHHFQYTPTSTGPSTFTSDITLSGYTPIAISGIQHPANTRQDYYTQDWYFTGNTFNINLVVNTIHTFNIWPTILYLTK